jgi:phosphatidylcholine synthase
VTGADRARGFSVHLLTASGIVAAFLAAAETVSAGPDPRVVFAWLGLAVIIDSVDGPLARRWRVKETVPGIDGRTIDDIVDYITFTFLPVLLLWRMEWVPRPALLFLAPVLMASLLGFANVKAKQEAGGFFLGFPSYWNVFAFYAGIVCARWGPWIPGLAALALAALTVAPVRFAYPNLAPRPWKAWLIGGAIAWTAVLIAMLPSYPRTSLGMLVLSLVYPAFYFAVWAKLDREARARPRTA